MIVQIIFCIVKYWLDKKIANLYSGVLDSFKFFIAFTIE